MDAELSLRSATGYRNPKVNYSLSTDALELVLQFNYRRGEVPKCFFVNDRI